MVFAAAAPTAGEVAATLTGDELVPDANVVMDRAFDLDAAVEDVWPWFVQLGKGRGGWYLPHRVERLIPRSRRAAWRVDPDLQSLAVGDVIADWGGADAIFEVAVIEPPHSLVHMSTRGRVRLSWAITLREQERGTRVHLRLRLAGVKHERLAALAGGFFDEVTIIGLAAGLRQRLAR